MRKPSKKQRERRFRIACTLWGAFWLCAYSFMLGTAWGTGEPYGRCKRLQDTNFNDYLKSYQGDK